MTQQFIVSKDFSPYPGGRYRHSGPNSGEEMRKKIIERLTSSNEDLEIVFDERVAGACESFLEEVFGGLARESKGQSFLDRITVVCECDPDIVRSAVKYASRGEHW